MGDKFLLSTVAMYPGGYGVHGEAWLRGLGFVE
jgi:hypothetical protein